MSDKFDPSGFGKMLDEACESTPLFQNTPQPDNIWPEMSSLDPLPPTNSIPSDPFSDSYHPIAIHSTEAVNPREDRILDFPLPVSSAVTYMNEMRMSEGRQMKDGIVQGNSFNVGLGNDEKEKARGKSQKVRRIAKSQMERKTRTEAVLDIINSEEIMDYCQAKGLLLYVVECRCRGWMKRQVYRQHTDGYIFRCVRCRKKNALRTGSVFESSRLTIRTILKIWLAFVKGTRIAVCEKDLGIAHSTAVRWYDFCREVCTRALLKAEGHTVLSHINEVQYRLWFGLQEMDLEGAWNLFLSHVAAAYPLESGKRGTCDEDGE